MPSPFRTFTWKRELLSFCELVFGSLHTSLLHQKWPGVQPLISCGWSSQTSCNTVNVLTLLLKVDGPCCNSTKSWLCSVLCKDGPLPPIILDYWNPYERVQVVKIVCSLHLQEHHHCTYDPSYQRVAVVNSTKIYLHWSAPKYILQTGQPPNPFFGNARILLALDNTTSSLS